MATARGGSDPPAPGLGPLPGTSTHSLIPSPMICLVTIAEGGFNPLDPAGLGNLMWTLVIFLVALPFMWKVVMGPVVRALEERDDHVVRSIQAAEKASAEAEAARAEVEVKLGEARSEASRLMAEARERAEDREREIVEASKQEAVAMVENARTQIQVEQEKAIAAIRTEVVELSLNAASKVIGRTVDAEDDRKLVEGLVGATRDEGSPS